MVDLGHLARQSSDILPNSSAAVLNDLDECILYKVNGPYRTESTGRSCYYPYTNDEDDFYDYYHIGAGSAFTNYDFYIFKGELNENEMDYLSSNDIY